MGNTAVWEDLPWNEKNITPNYLMGESVANSFGSQQQKTVFRAITNATNKRTFVVAFRAVARATDKRTLFAAMLSGSACGNKLLVLSMPQITSLKYIPLILNSFVFDWIVRLRLAGIELSQFIMQDCPVLKPDTVTILKDIAELLNNHDRIFCKFRSQEKGSFAITEAELLRLKVISDVVVGKLYGLDYTDMKFILMDCDHPVSCTSNKKFCAGLNPKGFWRVDKERPPEQRQTVLTLVAFHELEKLIQETGSQEAGIKAFLALNDGEGWMLPEMLRLADYSLGHDAEAQEFRPVASVYGPRFYDWQLAQTPEEFRKECEIHAYNLNIGRNKDTEPDADAIKTKPEIEQLNLF